MRTNRLVPIFFLALISSGLFLDPASPLPAAPPKSTAGGVGVVSTGISATLPDPKRPGKLLYELRAQSANGQSDASGFHGDLNSVWARLYQNGVPSAILTAPHAQGGSAGKSVTITGTGGVVVKSLTEPGTLLTADTVVWYASSNKVVATGHVFYRSGKTGATMRGPRAVGYTQLKSIIITGGGHGSAKI